MTTDNISFILFAIPLAGVSLLLVIDTAIQWLRGRK
jgi:hypothetical protein